MYLPEAFQKKMKAILGEEYDDFLAGFEKPRHYGLRVNTAKITVEEFKELVPFHLTQIPWVENGFYYEEEDAPTRHPYYYAGLYYCGGRKRFFYGYICIWRSCFTRLP